MISPLEEKLKTYFEDMVVFKSPDQVKFFASLSLPSFMRDWLVMKFSDPEGRIDTDEVASYVRKFIPQKEDWERLKYAMIRDGKVVKILAKVRVEVDVAKRKVLFSLPDFGFPKKKYEAVVDDAAIKGKEHHLLRPGDVWGTVELVCEPSLGDKGNVMKMISFKPFCPYEVTLDYFCDARQYFTTEEWIDVLLSAVDYNPKGFATELQKLTLLTRLTPFVEKRLNLIELAPKGTGKSYIFSKISKYGWLVSGGSISRAKMFYDMNTKVEGLVSHYDYVVFDEIQSVRFTDEYEMRGALKGYLESGDYRVGNHRGVGEAGLVLLGNIDQSFMDVNRNIFSELPSIFRESALLDRFHGFIKGWDIPRMHEGMKASGWALNVEYFSEILHLLRGELVYRAVVDEIVEVPPNADTRDTEAIKRLCTGLLKLLFPHQRSPESIQPEEFVKYCLEPAKKARRIIKIQLGILDSEFRGKDIPDIRLKE